MEKTLLQLVTKIHASDIGWVPTMFSLSFSHRVVYALPGASGSACAVRRRRSVHGESVLPDHQLVDVDDQPDQALQDHGREQVHVDPGHLLLPELPVFRRGKGKEDYYSISKSGSPANIGIAMATLSVATLVVVKVASRHLG